METVYFGGGTPSVLTKEELGEIFAAIHNNYTVLPNAEISFECNPDDITEEYCADLLSFGINRLSIGIQSFSDDDLQMLNRRHNSESARNAVKYAQRAGFKNISIDLIYGLPKMTLEHWKKNLAIANELNVQHLSAYTLMVEEQTVLHKLLRDGKMALPQEESVLEQFTYLTNWAETVGFEQYEISNFAKDGMYSRHNSAYWSGKPYIGVGPAAHSFDGSHRSWNTYLIQKYIDSIAAGIIPCETETLTEKDIYNELILTGLRTKNGIDSSIIASRFPQFFAEFQKQKETFLAQQLIQAHGQNISLTRQGIMLSDEVMREFFVI